MPLFSPGRLKMPDLLSRFRWKMTGFQPPCALAVELGRL
jgi:hypothetical protein